jgi:hypothetical protein
MSVINACCVHLAQHWHDTRATWRTSYANFACNICVSYVRQIHAGCASHPRIRCKCCVHLPHEERATRDVTSGPLCPCNFNGISEGRVLLVRYRTWKNHCTCACESDANVARTCRARSAQQGMLLLDPSVQKTAPGFNGTQILPLARADLVVNNTPKFSKWSNSSDSRSI